MYEISITPTTACAGTPWPEADTKRKKARDFARAFPLCQLVAEQGCSAEILLWFSARRFRAAGIDFDDAFQSVYLPFFLGIYALRLGLRLMGSSFSASGTRASSSIHSISQRPSW